MDARALELGQIGNRQPAVPDPGRDHDRPADDRFAFAQLHAERAVERLEPDGFTRYGDPGTELLRLDRRALGELGA